MLPDEINWEEWDVAAISGRSGKVAELFTTVKNSYLFPIHQNFIGLYLNSGILITKRNITGSAQWNIQLTVTIHSTHYCYKCSCFSDASLRLIASHQHIEHSYT